MALPSHLSTHHYHCFVSLLLFSIENTFIGNNGLRIWITPTVVWNLTLTEPVSLWPGMKEHRHLLVQGILPSVFMSKNMYQLQKLLHNTKFLTDFLLNGFSIS